MNCRFIVITFLLIMLVPSICFAGTKNYLIDIYGNIFMLDFSGFEASKVTKFKQITTVGLERDSVAIDKLQNNIYLENIDEKGVYHTVDIVDLTNFEHKATIDGIVSKRKINIVLNANKQSVYINWWDQSLDKKSGEQVLSIINAVDFSNSADYRGIKRTENIALSDDGRRLFLNYTELPDFYIDSYNTDDFKLIGRIDISNSLTVNDFRRGINGYMNYNFLVVENVYNASTSSANYLLYLYNLNQNKFTDKLTTGTRGNSILIGDGNTVVFDETMHTGAPLYRLVSTGKLHFYNLLTTTKLGDTSLSAGKYNGIVGTFKDRNIILYYTSNDTNSSFDLHAINLSTYKVVGTFSLENTPAHIFQIIIPDEAPTQ